MCFICLPVRFKVEQTQIWKFVKGHKKKTITLDCKGKEYKLIVITKKKGNLARWDQTTTSDEYFFVQ